MKKLLRKAFRKIEIENKEGVNNSAISLLEKDLSRIDSLQKGLGQQLLKYVIDGGESEESLLALAGISDAPFLLRLRKKDKQQHIRREQSAERKSFFEKCDEVPAVVVHRACRVYETALAADPSTNWRWDHLNSEERWLEFLFEELLQFDIWGNYKLDLIVPVEKISRVCAASDNGSTLLAKHILTPASGYWNRWVDVLKGVGEFLVSEEPTLSPFISEGAAAKRVDTLELLSRAKTVLPETLLTLVCDQSVGSSKTARTAAVGTIIAQPKEGKSFVIQQVKDYLKSGSASQRFHAIPTLVKLEGDSCYPFLEECLKTEKGKKVKAELEKYLNVQSAGSGEEGSKQSVYEDELVTQTAQVFPEEITLSSEVEQAFHQAIDRFNEKAMADYTKRWNQMDKSWRKGSSTISAPLNEKNAKKIFKGLLNKETVLKHDHIYKRKNYYYQCGLGTEMREFAQTQNLGIIPTIRLAFLCGFIMSPKTKSHYRNFHIDEEGKDLLREAMERNKSYSLLDVGAAFISAGLDVRWVEKLYASSGWGERFNPLDLNEKQIWPFFLEHQNWMKQIFGLITLEEEIHSYYFSDYKKRAYNILSTFPRPPKDFAPYLWSQALGTSKTERPLAQACLTNYPNREVVIIAALTDGKKDVRASAATWLGELNAKEAVAPLKALLKKEKYDEVKAAAIGALESLGEDIDQFLNRKKLLEEAEKGLKKPIHKDLAWFPFDQLPEVRWEKNKQKVPADIIKWFIVQAFKVKKPEPNPLMRRYFSLMRPKEREVLGKFVLDAWLAEDTKPAHTREEAEKHADASLKQTLQWVKSHPQYYTDFDEQQFRKGQLNHFLNECLGSANGSKGILSVAACCCGPEVVPQVEKYIRFWYGKRLHQGKALVQMLSWIDHPLAIQLILALGTRFRTKGIQTEAGACADLIAERKGWTRDEMADRTIPSAGFNREGTQVIDYGMRQFNVKLMDDFSIELKNADGKVIKALPAANKAEDEDEVKALKKDFTASKKELKQVLKLQQERIYEAMCTERKWGVEEWDIYLNQHPIVGRFCQRLIWVAYDKEGNQVSTFRPLADGTLTDFEDEEIMLADGHIVKIAHQSFLSEKDVKSWEEHLSDYEVTPLFAQFGKKLFKTDQEFIKKTEIEEFYGHLVNSFKLRSRTNKLGYTRGAAEDGGWFYTYQKTFPGLRIQAVIEFTGNGLPEEDRTVALQKLYFTSMKDENDSYAHSHRALKLKEIPEVMLSECWNDIKLMSEDGSGFDKDWEKKSAY